MIQWAILIIHMYVFFNPAAPSSHGYFDPCDSSNIEKYAIKDEKKLDFFQDCAIINGRAGNSMLWLQNFKTDKEKQEYINKVREYYESN